jgi:hypothetical protein
MLGKVGGFMRVNVWGSEGGTGRVGAAVACAQRSITRGRRGNKARVKWKRAQTWRFMGCVQASRGAAVFAV